LIVADVGHFHFTIFKQRLKNNRQQGRDRFCQPGSCPMSEKFSRGGLVSFLFNMMENEVIASYMKKAYYFGVMPIFYENDVSGKPVFRQLLSLHVILFAILLF
jgi:hypothetical protein